ncbi:MAG: hypothetical protein G01um101433_243 [Parcubacteria group bacterium Gr01-1014_33]|nr:MAG: hypothetical protein G01um101433_243 [Parcubacteria group bacterium Gr01-1014_33]
MTEQEELLKKIGKILDTLAIPYVITGGIAVTVWGRPRFTADIDVAVDLLPQKLDALARALLKIDKDVYVDKRMMLHALERCGEFNFIHPAAGLKVDFWILKNTPFDREELRRRVRRKVAGVSIALISPEDLILRKLLWYKESESDRQLEDIESVIRRQKKLDRRYLKKWAAKQSTLSMLEELWKKNAK